MNKDVSLHYIFFVIFTIIILLISLLFPLWLADNFVISTISRWCYFHDISLVFLLFQLFGPNVNSFIHRWTNAKIMIMQRLKIYFEQKCFTNIYLMHSLYYLANIFVISTMILLISLLFPLYLAKIFDISTIILLIFLLFP